MWVFNPLIIKLERTFKKQIPLGGAACWLKFTRDSCKREEGAGQAKEARGPVDKLHSLSSLPLASSACVCVRRFSRQLNCITLFILVIWTRVRCGIWWCLVYWTTSGQPGTLQQMTVNLRAAMPPPRCQQFRGKSRAFTVYVSKLNLYFLGFIFRVIRNVCLFPGRLQMQDSYNKTRAGRFPEGRERKVFPAWLELLCVCYPLRERRG